MIFQRFKEFLIEKKLQKLLAQETSLEGSQKKIQSIGILTADPISSKINLQEEFAHILGVRNCKVYSFRKFQKTDKPSQKHFSENDINWNGKFTQANFQDFLEQPFDLLIGYFKESNVYLESAILYSKANFKVGFSQLHQQLYTLEIDLETNNLKGFAEELKKYLIVLKKL